MRKSIIERILKQTDFNSPTGCWLWKGLTSKGYGHISINNRMRRVHRIVFKIFNPRISKDTIVCHACDVRNCCNPKHLWAGTTKDNARDKTVKNRQPKGEKHGRAKLTHKEVQEIRTLYATGKYTTITLGKRFKVHPSNIGIVVNEKGWRNSRKERASCLSVVRN